MLEGDLCSQRRQLNRTTRGDKFCALEEVCPHRRAPAFIAANPPTAVSSSAPAPARPVQPITQPSPAPPGPAQSVTATQPPMMAQQMFTAEGYFGEGIYPDINPTLVCPCHLEGHPCRYPVRKNHTHNGKTLCDLVAVCTSKVQTY